MFVNAILINILVIVAVDAIDLNCDRNTGKNCACIEKPCFRKCCKLGETYENEKCVKHNFSVESINIKMFDDQKIESDNHLQSFKTIIYGVPCRGVANGGAFIGNDFKLFNNGSASVISLENGSKREGQEDLFLEPDDYCSDFKHDYSDDLYLLFCYDTYEIPTLLYYSSFCIFISIPFLIATEIVFFLIDGFSNNLPGKITISQILSLTISFLILADIRFVGFSRSRHVCRAFGYLAQYGILSNFFWLNVMCFDIWLVFSGISSPFRNFTKDEEMKKFLRYGTYAWGAPVLICSATYIADIILPKNSEFRPAVGEDFCLLKRNYSRVVFYFLPLTILLVLNVAMFSATAYKIYTHKKQMAVLKSDGSNINNKMEKERLNLYFKLFLVMGLTWTTEPLSRLFNEEPEWLWTLLDSVNLLQGIPIFIIFVCKRRTLRAITHKICPTKSYFTGTTSTKHGSSNVNSPNSVTSTSSISNTCCRKSLNTVRNTKDKSNDIEMVPKENNSKPYKLAEEA